MYNKIIAAFDGSEGSMRALEHAIELCKLDRANLTVVHVEKENNRSTQRPLTSGSDMSVNYGGADVKAYEGKVEDREYVPSDFKTNQSSHEIFSEVKRVVGKEQIFKNFEVLKGDPVKRLCKYASTNNMDLIVIGSRGSSGIKKFMLGSVSEKVAKEADVPVLIVK